MIKRSFVLVSSLLSCLTIFGMDKSSSDGLGQSTDKLRNSQGSLSRSQSQELNKLAMQAAVNNIWHEYPGNSGSVYDRRERMPVQFGRDYSDCP